jgi:hypothetical protein
MKDERTNIVNNKGRDRLGRGLGGVERLSSAAKLRFLTTNVNETTTLSQEEKKMSELQIYTAKRILTEPVPIEKAYRR